MGELANLPNIGSVIEDQLNAVGITTYTELCDLGSKEAWLRIKSIDASACINRLYGLEGAIRGVKKSLLPPQDKAKLKAFYIEQK